MALQKQVRSRAKPGKTTTTRRNKAPAGPGTTKGVIHADTPDPSALDLYTRIERLEALCAYLLDRDRVGHDVSICSQSKGAAFLRVGAKELSGPAWVGRFPGSRSPEDCSEPFRKNLKSFLAALSTAGATVRISSTLRPPERAWLMHWAWAIAKEGQDPTEVEAKEGVDIEWVHRNGNAIDLGASRRAAAAMVAEYGMDAKASLTGRHMEGRAVDMNVVWNGTLEIADAEGSKCSIVSTPRDGLNKDLHVCAATYGVIKAKFKDDPHWSDDGH